MSVPGRLSAVLADRYRIERELGQGGMATVYLAADLKHDRQVAIKVLKPELAAVVGGDRFISEIRTTANLQHPHILPLFDSGEADGFLFYVMPYVEGETLREKLDREKQLSVPEAIAITVKIAGALQTAHDQGVIHRDIKPANILLQNGEPVVADFGIALAVRQAGEGRITETGLSLGTPYYMAPEQATGDRDPDARSDLYSLACMLYEMLVGDPPFTGSTAQAVLGRILTQTAPRVTETRPTVPPHVDAVLARALQKLPADRFDSVAEFSRALQNEGYVDPAARASGAWASARETGPTWQRVLPWGVAAVAVGLAAWGWVGSAEPEPTRTFNIDVSEVRATGVRADMLRVSPDGRVFLLEGRDTVAGEPRLYVRRLDESRFRLLAEAGAAIDATFSPDSRSIAYTSLEDGAYDLMRISVDGGQPTTLLQREGFDASEAGWGDDGNIYFYGSHADGRAGESGLYRIPENGAGDEPELLLGNADWLWFPRPLPGGRGVLFVDARRTGDPELALYDLEADSVRTLVREATSGMYVATGHLVYGHRDGGLRAVPFDLKRMEVTGDPLPVVDDVSVVAQTTGFAVSEEGTLVYLAGRRNLRRNWAISLPVEHDLATGEEEPFRLRPAYFLDVAYRPEGRWAVFSRADDSENDPQIFVYDIQLGTQPSPLSSEHYNMDPTWSPTGDEVAWMQTSGDSMGLWVRAPFSDSAPRRIADWSRRARNPHWATSTQIVVRENSADRNSFDLGIRDPTGGSPPSTYLPSAFDSGQPRVSPDQSFIAYTSDDSGRDEVWVRSFPVPGAVPGEPLQVSFASGRRARWTPDSRGIYFWETDGSLMLAHLRTQPTLGVDSTTTVLEGGGRLYEVSSYDVHPDGDRLLLLRNELDESGEPRRANQGAAEPERYVVVLNWFEELKARLGGR